MGQCSRAGAMYSRSRARFAQRIERLPASRSTPDHTKAVAMDIKKAAVRPWHRTGTRGTLSWWAQKYALWAGSSQTQGYASIAEGVLFLGCKACVRYSWQAQVRLACQLRHWIVAERTGMNSRLCQAPSGLLGM